VKTSMLRNIGSGKERGFDSLRPNSGTILIIMQQVVSEMRSYFVDLSRAVA